jgi:hypothetical protein
MGETGPANGRGIIGGVVNAFKLRPDFLAILVLNVVFLGIVYFAQEHRREQEGQERIALLERCFPTREEKN